MLTLTRKFMFANWTIKEAGFALAVLINLVAVVWGAAEMSAGLEQMNDTVAAMDKRLSRVETTQIEMRVRLAVQEAMKNGTSEP